jgi:16S rRNA (adenine1518-N6/adenine1519-N6)-dimethyltransferase
MSRSGKRRALGQHFLRDSAIAHAIVDLVAPTSQDLAVEIGPGRGALSSLLASRAGAFLAIEIDPFLAERLAGSFDVRVADARTFDYASLEAPGGRVLAVGNLPYSMSKPILARLADAHATIAEMALMLQLEVAERVVAPPGGKVYGSLSVLTQLHWDVSLALRVPPRAFVPPPQVESAVLHLRARPASRVPLADESQFRRIVLAAFEQRRKAVANSLSSALRVPVTTARARLVAAGIDPSLRAETLSIEEFGRLTVAWHSPAA